MVMRKNYSGSDLSTDFKKFFRTEKSRLTKIFKAKGCTDIQMNYGFYYFSGFLTAPSGQVYYFSCFDVRDSYTQLLIRRAKDYKDFTGGSNNFINVNEVDRFNFN
jgi:hypothetical protein